jgi:large subunit ribosomal protein L33
MSWYKPLHHGKEQKNTPERMELKKFNPILKKVTVHKEIK